MTVEIASVDNRSVIGAGEILSPLVSIDMPEANGSHGGVRG